MRRIEETIPSPLEWEDVAHLYKKSDINMAYERDADLARGEEARSGKCPIWGAIDFPDHAFDPPLPKIKYTPVLRHLDDMTQDDADSLARAIGLTDGWFATSSLGAIVVGNVTEREKLFGDPRAWVWALNNGFDLFGLIDRGLAMRKEVEK